MRVTGSPLPMCFLTPPEMSSRLEQRTSVTEAMLALSQLLVFMLCSDILFSEAESLLPGVGGRLTSLQFPEPPLGCICRWDLPWQIACVPVQRCSIAGQGVAYVTQSRSHRTPRWTSTSPGDLLTWTYSFHLMLTAGLPYIRLASLTCALHRVGWEQTSPHHLHQQKEKQRINWASLLWLFHSWMSFLHLGHPAISQFLVLPAFEYLHNFFCCQRKHPFQGAPQVHF